MSRTDANPTMRNLLQVAAHSRTARLLTLTALGATAPRMSQAQAPVGTGIVVVRVTADSLPVSGARIAAAGTSANSATDRSGLARFTLPTGRRSLRVTSTGYRPESLAVNVAA